MGASVGETHPLGPGLPAHIKRCVASVQGQTRGSGFFIDSDLVLTCAHVAGITGASVVVTPHQGEPRSGHVELASPADDNDLALVRLEPQSEDATPQPAMLVNATAPAGDLAFAPGFPTFKDADNSDDWGYELVELQYRVNEAREAGGTDRLQIINGEVANGLSGAALVSSSDLAVVGVVRYRRPTPTGLAAGGAIPIQVVASQFPVVDQLIAKPPAAAYEWRALTGQHHEGVQEERPRIDLSISGDGRKWGVDELSPESPPPSITAGRFGDDVGRAVFAWVSRRRPTSEQEVRWSGELLGIALLPGSAGRKVTHHHAFGAPFDLRLNFRGSSELEDAPWELASIPSSPATEAEPEPAPTGVEHHLATRARTSMTRVDPTGSTELRVAGSTVVVCALVPGKSNEATNVMSLDQSITRISFAVHTNNLFSEQAIQLINESAVGTPTIVHYIGYARRHQTKDVELLIGTKGEGSFMPLQRLARACGEAGVRVLIIQTKAPRPNVDWGPTPPPSSFAHLLKDGLEGVIFTQYAVTATPLAAFNRAFYKELNNSARLEDAVQVARATLHEHYYDGEPSAFGAFVVVTGSNGGPTLLSRRDVESTSGPSYGPVGRPTPTIRTAART
jgi:hypothetical protein